jgi:hypothetical protein
LNFVGEKTAPELWKNERETFKEAGLAGKLGAVCQQCRIEVPKKGARRCATVSEVKKLIDGMAHLKTRTARNTVKFSGNKRAPLFQKSHLATLVSPEDALRAQDHIKHIVEKHAYLCISLAKAAAVDGRSLPGYKHHERPVTGRSAASTRRK